MNDTICLPNQCLNPDFGQARTTNDLSNVDGIECAYSIDDLYFAAFGKKISKNLKLKFQKFPQNEINSLVLKWAKKAKWKTKEKIGTDGIIYMSFYH